MHPAGVLGGVEPRVNVVAPVECVGEGLGSGVVLRGHVVLLWHRAPVGLVRGLVQQILFEGAVVVQRGVEGLGVLNFVSISWELAGHDVFALDLGHVVLDLAVNLGVQLSILAHFS